jgi:histidinol-phosphate aminotransferase
VKNRSKKRYKGIDMAVGYRKALDAINPYKPARSLESVKREFGLTEIIKLSGNENNHGFSPQVSRAIMDAQTEITRYPDTHNTKLRETLSGSLGVKEDELIFGNGSFELISLTAQAFLEEGAESLIPMPSFGWYANATKAANGTPVIAPLKDNGISLDLMYEHISNKTRIVWLCNPNNPTGTVFSGQELEKFLQKTGPDILVALDEAYIDFAPGNVPKAADLIHRYPNVVSLRTFSKVYGLASLRLGYAFADAAIIDKLGRVRQPINTNMIAQVAALASLKDTDFYNYVIAENERGRQLYYSTLKRLGLKYIPTNCNFIMLDTGLDSTELELAFLKRGILLRAGKEFGMPTWLRITIGTEQENRKVLEILEELIKKGN